MTFQEFINTLQATEPPANLSQNLTALWLDAHGDWDTAHGIVQRTGGYEGDWIHAYLHRKEGDASNASYWYSRIGKPKPHKPLEEEWEELARHLLKIK